MNVEQYVMAYQVEQDRLRALLPEGFSSLRPVLRINVEIRNGETVYLEYNTPVAARGRRGWLNIANWASSSGSSISFEKSAGTTSFSALFLQISFTRVGAVGGCPAERDNDGCFFPGETPFFRPAEKILAPREFCDCVFAWKYDAASAHGASVGGKSIAAAPTPPQIQYAKGELSPQAAAAIKCEQILGAYAVTFTREG